MNLDTIVLISAVLLIVVLGVIVWYRRGNELYQYEKLKNFEKDSVNNLLQLPSYVAGRAPPPCQPFIPSPEQKHPVPYEAYSALISNEPGMNENPVNASFQRFNTAYKAQLMDLPPVVKRQRLNPPGQQPVDPYSGLPVSVFSVDENINKFYHEFVPDYLWCKQGVCG